ncbi:hypothetical protein CWE15_11955 [Aliidiomarina taiwanensis]|uniref:Uncharacterized protein n=1 Tax=Aliidiomarina taiwanensis TaxID=946228 RepID=A0A432WR40_9GAMM|nr:hypothetical protein [Aliidiomarina taiwanensis]RUO36240.1 hypothetical protein CWE15_11955 [Aliidiomarina taiwanensis]
MNTVIYIVILAVVAALIGQSHDMMNLINVPAFLIFVLLWAGFNLLFIKGNQSIDLKSPKSRLVVWKEQIKILYSAGLVTAALGLALVGTTWNGLSLNVAELAVALLPLLYAVLATELVVRPIVRNKEISLSTFQTA